jgi:hypothetical protein
MKDMFNFTNVRLWVWSFGRYRLFNCLLEASVLSFVSFVLRLILGSATIATHPPSDTHTAIPPLASISFGMPTQVPPAFTNTFKPGATPSIAGVPVLPSARLFSNTFSPN